MAAATIVPSPSWRAPATVSTETSNQLALTVGATGLWVDFSKDVVLFSPHNDVVKLFSGWCMTGWKQLPARLVYASLVVASGYVVARSYQKTFGQQDDVMSVPLLTASF